MTIQAVIGVDGVIQPGSLRTHTWSAAECVLRDSTNPDPMAAAQAFADHRSELAFDGAASEGPGDKAPPPESKF